MYPNSSYLKQERSDICAICQGKDQIRFVMRFGLFENEIEIESSVEVK